VQILDNSTNRIDASFDVILPRTANLNLQFGSPTVRTLLFYLFSYILRQ